MVPEQSRAEAAGADQAEEDGGQDFRAVLHAAIIP
jgi:hypothetical protein